MTDRGTGGNDRGYDKFIPKVVTKEEAEKQERLSNEQIAEVNKWRALSPDERRAAMQKLINEIEIGPASGSTGAGATGSKDSTRTVPTGLGAKVPPKGTQIPEHLPTDDVVRTAAQGSNAGLLIGNIISVLSSIRPEAITNADMGTLIEIHVLLRTIQIREGLPRNGDRTGGGTQRLVGFGGGGNDGKEMSVIREQDQRRKEEAKDGAKLDKIIKKS